MPPAGSLCCQPGRADPGTDTRWLCASLKDRWEETALEAAGVLRLGLCLTECGVAENEMHTPRAGGCLICIKMEVPRASKLTV